MSGYVRGGTLNVNGLVHIPGVGDFQMKQIDAPTDPYPLNTSNKRNMVGDRMSTGTGAGQVFITSCLKLKFTSELLND